MHIIVTFIALGAGLFLSFFMFLKKLRHTELVCPREHPCDIVLHSRFSKTFGISNELLGTFYFISILALLLIPSSGAVTLGFLYVLFLILILGGLFSLYLLGLQLFVIRSWCLWCVGVALCNTVVIISLLSSFPFEKLSPLFLSQKTFWIIIHNIGFILGLGATTITDIFFFRFLKDNTISSEEKETMDTLTNVIWVGLAILIVSGLALYLSDVPRLSVSSKFLLKVVVVGVIVVNGIFLNMFVAPFLKRLSFEGTPPARRFRRLAFALGGISFTSWYVAFFLGSFRSLPISFQTGLWAYLTIIVFVIIGSQILERYVAGTHRSKIN